MTANERRDAIATALHERPVRVDALANRFGVSLSTIRRDLESLAEVGKVVRTYGGAQTVVRGEQSLLERSSIATKQKSAIGRLAATFVPPGSLNTLDAGTTVGALASRLVNRAGITVVTNGLTTMNLLEHGDGVDLIVIGGNFRHVSSGLVGPIAEAAMSCGAKGR